MPARPFVIRGLPEPDRPGLPAILRPWLAVIAPSTAEVVRWAGGWLFDHVMAGWEAAALITGDADPRPLQIIGARAYDLEAVLAARPPGQCLHALAVQADLYRTDARVLRVVDQALKAGLAEVRLWGSDPAAGPAGGVNPALHHLSVAARAFKAHALAAAAAPADVSATEVFWTHARRFAAVTQC